MQQYYEFDSERCDDTTHYIVIVMCNSRLFFLTVGSFFIHRRFFLRITCYLCKKNSSYGGFAEIISYWDTDIFTICERNYLYIDKTEYVYRMTHSDSNYMFLSRPRRFGKSLLTSTLHSYFSGRDDMFRGLAIEKLEKEWTVYPVLHFDISTAKHADKEQLLQELNLKLSDYEAHYGKEDEEINPNQRLMGLIKRAYEQTGQKVVVLIDEYDAPLLDVLHEQENILDRYYQILTAQHFHACIYKADVSILAYLA